MRRLPNEGIFCMMVPVKRMHRRERQGQMNRWQTNNIPIKMKKFGCSAYVLKWAAAVTMLIDHTAAVVVKGWVMAGLAGYSAQQVEAWNLLYDWMRRIGRTAFPLFAFLLVEGFCHTHSRRRYAGRLLAAALLSEIPYDLAFSGKIDFSHQNTLFTLLLGLLLLQGYEWLGKREKLPALGKLFCHGGLLLFFGAFSWYAHTDYSYKGLILISVFYLFRQFRMAAAIGGFCAFSWSPWSFPAFLLLAAYDGSRGKSGQRFFYLFYPLHLLFLFLILKMILGIFSFVENI